MVNLQGPLVLSTRSAIGRLRMAAEDDSSDDDGGGVGVLEKPAPGLLDDASNEPRTDMDGASGLSENQRRCGGGGSYKLLLLKDPEHTPEKSKHCVLGSKENIKETRKKKVLLLICHIEKN